MLAVYARQWAEEIRFATFHLAITVGYSSTLSAIY